MSEKTSAVRSVVCHHRGSLIKRLKSLSLIICLSSLAWSPFSIADKEAERARLKALKEAITELKKELESTKSSRDTLLKSLEQSEKSISNLNQKAKKIESELKDRKTHIKQLQNERSDLKSKTSEQKHYVQQHLNTAYRLGQQSNIRLILNQQDPSTVTRNLKYHDYLIKARADAINEYTTTISRINELEPEISAEAIKLERNFDDLREKQDHLKTANKAREKTLAALNLSIRNTDQRLQGMSKDRKRLEELLAQVSQYLGDIFVPQSKTSFSSQKGKLPWPASGKVLKRYGTSRVAGKLKWEGILIGSNAGSPVQAVHHGRIIFSDYLRGHGLLIIIDHGAGFMTLYAHNQTLYKELGDWVDSEEVIASVGNSGGQKEAALYFQLRQNGNPTNPKKWFKPA